MSCQLGLVGAAELAVLVATERRSTVHAWPALVLVLFTTTSVTESYLLIEGRFMLVVTAGLLAARERSRRRL